MFIFILLFDNSLCLTPELFLGVRLSYMNEKIVFSYFQQRFLFLSSSKVTENPPPYSFDITEKADANLPFQCTPTLQSLYKITVTMFSV